MASLESDTQQDGDDDDDDDCGTEPHRPQEASAAADEKVGSKCVAPPAEEYDFFDDVPLGDDDGDCAAVPGGIDDSDSDSDSSDEEDVENDVAVWPAPLPIMSTSVTAAVPGLPPARPECGRDAPLYTPSSSPDTVASTAGGDADEWDAVDCGASPMMGQLRPSVPILGC